MFMVLSSWQSHCESSPGSFDECRMVPSDRRPKTKPDDLGCESACSVIINSLLTKLAQDGHIRNQHILTYTSKCYASLARKVYTEVKRFATFCSWKYEPELKDS